MPTLYEKTRTTNSPINSLNNKMAGSESISRLIERSNNKTETQTIQLKLRVS